MEHARQIEQAFTTQAEAFEEAARDEIRAALRGDVAAEAVTGFTPRAAGDGELWFVQTFGSAIASKPS
jgi:hypothetical protein